MNRIDIHRTLCDKLHDIYLSKNADYGNSFAEVREEFPEAILIRLSDKLNRLKVLICEGKTAQVSSESIEDTLVDLANYAIMELVERKIDAAKGGMYYENNRKERRAAGSIRRVEDT